MDITAQKPETEAITMEEVTPLTVSNATLLAPEEIHEKSDKVPFGELEKTSTPCCAIDDSNHTRRRT